MSQVKHFLVFIITPRYLTVRSKWKLPFALRQSTHLGQCFRMMCGRLWANGSTEKEDNALVWLFGDLTYRDWLAKAIGDSNDPVRPIDYGVPCLPSTRAGSQFEITTATFGNTATLPLVSVTRTFKVCNPLPYLAVSNEYENPQFSGALGKAAGISGRGDP